MLKTKNAHGKNIRERLKDKESNTTYFLRKKSNNNLTNLSIQMEICCGVMVVHVIFPSLSYLLFGVSCGASIVTETVLFP